jgi:hypothetical protein
MMTSPSLRWGALSIRNILKLLRIIVKFEMAHGKAVKVMR